MALDSDSRLPGRDCAFCQRSSLEVVLLETEHFLLLADHAPVIEGHVLIVPREHYACYGALPPALEDELLELKHVVARFFSSAYRAPVFWEHGIFHQTVFHAHLHAFPLGPLGLDVHALAQPAGCPVRSLADVRAWYAENGDYFYLEQPSDGEVPGAAAIFPPVEKHYFRVLGLLWARAGPGDTWLPPPARRALAGPKLRALTDAWRRHRQQ